jgi:phenylacetate-CoA ligase
MHGQLHDHQNRNSINSGGYDAWARAETMAAAMSARDLWPRERLIAFQQQRLREIVRHAVDHSPYYREVIGEIGNDAIDLQQLPVLTKSMLMSEFDRIVTDPRLRLASAEQHLAGETAADPLLGEYRVLGSGGTTGKRGIVLYDQIAWNVVVASLLRMLTLQGVSRDTRVLGIGAPTPLHMTNRMFATLRAGLRNDAPRLAVTTPIAEMVEALNAYQPEVIITYPSVIRRLAEAQSDGQLRIAPRKFCSAAETLMPEVRDIAQATWGCQVLNAYGSTEASLIGGECPWSTGIHVFEDLLVFEIVDEHNRPVPAGIAGHKVLVTNLFNRTLPFIRYELSDLVTEALGSCPCGRSHLRLASIQGRREDFLSLPARNGGRIRVHALTLSDVLLHMPEVRHYQMSPQGDALVVRVVLQEVGSKTKVLQGVREAVASRLNRLGATTDLLTVELVDEIKRVGSGAKERLVSPA